MITKRVNDQEETHKIQIYHKQWTNNQKVKKLTKI